MNYGKFILSIAALVSVFQAEAMDMNMNKKPDVLNSKMTSREQSEFRKAIMGMREILMKIHNTKNTTIEEQKDLNQREAIVSKYLELYPDDSFIVEKMNNHGKFLKKLERMSAVKDKNLSQSQVNNLLESQIVSPECCICMEEKQLIKLPCNNNHSDRICQSCLDEINKTNGLCPICRAELKK